MKKLITLALLIAFLGFQNGNMDTVKFHYSRSVYKIKHPTTQFQKWWDSWSNEQSWKNQYKDWDGGDHRKRFCAVGFLIWTCDFWHFLKTVLVISLMFVVWYSIDIYGIWYENSYKKDSVDHWLWDNANKWWFRLSFMAFGWFIYGVFHDIAFTVLLKNFWI